MVMKSQLFVLACACLARGNCLCLVFRVQTECSFLLLKVVFFSRALATRRKARNFLSSNLALAWTLAKFLLALPHSLYTVEMRISSRVAACMDTVEEMGYLHPGASWWCCSQATLF